MLESLDVLIGLTVIMLALSMAVTLMTQFATTVANSRGRHLKRGLVDLLSQLDPKLKDKVAETIAKAVLTHPLVSNSARRLGSVVHREEFTKLLLHFTNADSSLQATAKAALTAALRSNDITDPEATLKNVRARALQLEASNPQLASDVRQTIAILQEAPSDLVAKVNNWFDQTMDRVSQRFTASTRAITFAAACLVAFTLQVDTIGLVNRLSADSDLRQAFVSQAASLPPASGAPTETSVDRQYLAFLAQKGLLTVADSRSEWWERWGAVNIMGVLLTALLLSLGAPFWYNALGRLLQLRSVLAAKDDEQRAARQASDAHAGGKRREVAAPPAAGGERGDLVAVG